MTNVIDFTTSKTETLPIYEITYHNGDDEITCETFEGDAVMTTTFMGFVTPDSVLKFAIPMEALVTVRLMNEATETIIEQ